MMRIKKFFAALVLFFVVFANAPFVFAFQDEKKYLSYKDLYLEDDKYENFNRKIFDFNLSLNRAFVKKIHIAWESVFPNFVIDGLNSMYSNIEYPKKVVSALLQRDFDAVKHESKRFLINTTLGVAGFIDFADKIFKMEPYQEDMEQAFAKCKMKCGNYLVLPFLSSTNSRDILGRIFDFLLTPTTYVASPVAAAIKLGLLINRTAFIQPIVKMVESNYIDPYDIQRKVYGLEKYIKLKNLDRKSVVKNLKEDYFEEVVKEKNDFLEVKGLIKNSSPTFFYLADDKLSFDIYLENFNPQDPFRDSMRNALFSLYKKKGFWGEFSFWNRDFSKKIKVSSVELEKNKKKYDFRYLIQKDKSSPLAFVFPSVGEGIYNSSSQKLANMLYLKGYSVVIIGSQFQFEFLKSLKDGSKVGLIQDDIKDIDKLLSNIVSYLSKKYDRVFLKRIAVGTSLGAYTLLFLANEQFQTGANNIDKFIAISPPYGLIYAIEQIDKIIASWKNYPYDIKEKVAITASKLLYAYKNKDELFQNVNNFKGLPMSNFESKLVLGYIFHQKISDLIFAMEEKNYNKKEIYELIYNMDYFDYIKKYFLNDKNSLAEIEAKTNLGILEDYLIQKDNYIIYESLDDYLLSQEQLRKLRKTCTKKLKLLSNGSHLGYMYRKEFLDDLQKEFALAGKN